MFVISNVRVRVCVCVCEWVLANLCVISLLCVCVELLNVCACVRLRGVCVCVWNR